MLTPRNVSSEVVSHPAQKTAAQASPQPDRLPRFEEYEEHTTPSTYHPWGDVDSQTEEFRPWWNIDKCLALAICCLFWLTLLWLLVGR
jgi:hypothetical protein